MAKSKKNIVNKTRSTDEANRPTKKRRGRPEKPLRIDDTPENVARALFGLPLSKPHVIKFRTYTVFKIC